MRKGDRVAPIMPALARRGPLWTSPPVLGALASILVAAAIALRAMGRIWWCQCGELSPASLHVWSVHNSQHIIDPYTLTHVLHGVLFYAGFTLLLGGRAPRLRLVLAIAVEAAWEIFENTNWLIERYRQATVSLDYVGDSAINSLADILACAAGYAIAAVIPLWVSVAGVLLTELVLLAWIRDSLLLNVLMLLYPIDAIKTWQLRG